VSDAIVSVVVDVSKLRNYCLSPHHSRGRHKARVFRSRLGLETSDAECLRRILLDGARANLDRLVPADTDRYGQRYVLDLDVATALGNAAAWIVRANDDVLRFVSCFVL
jgi:hypothetical protein